MKGAILHLMSFQEQYPTLWNFFGGYFPDADFDNLTDEAVVAQYKAEVWAYEVAQAVAELDRLLADAAHWQTAADQANRYFETPAEMRKWLLMVRKELAG
jgi:hypothetical protein